MKKYILKIKKKLYLFESEAFRAEWPKPYSPRWSRGEAGTSSSLRLSEPNGLNPNEGVTLIMSLMILSLILATATAVSTIFTGEIKNSRIFEQSMYAYYAADSGSEALLYRQLKSSSPLNNGQNYNCSGTMGIIFSNNLIKCQLEVNNTTLRSTGTYNTIEAQRKIEINL